jgi:transposase
MTQNRGACSKRIDFMRATRNRRAVGADPEALPEVHIADDRPGRKPIPIRKVLDAALWILNTGAQWHTLPQSYPNYKTVHRRSQ